jgi:hypothetical protein
MAKRAKRKAAKKKSKPAKKRKPAKRAAKKSKAKKSRAKTSSRKRAVKRKSPGTARSAPRRVPSEPAGQIGLRRPSNQPKPPGQNEPRELAQAEPDARFDDPRKPESMAREHPDGSAPPLERSTQYKNTDEPF